MAYVKESIATMTDVTVVASQDKAQRNSTMSDSVENESTVLIATASRVCYWNGARFEEGARVKDETGGRVYECSLGHWVSTE